MKWRRISRNCKAYFKCNKALKSNNINKGMEDSTEFREVRIK